MNRAGPWLVLDTGSADAVVGVWRDQTVCAEVVLREARRHAENLPAAIADVVAQAGLALSDLVGVAVGEGPGSFIGLRVGLATAKGLCVGLGIPLVGLPSLQAIANSLAPDERVVAGARGVAFLDAKRGEVFSQRMTWTSEGASVEGAASASSPSDACAAIVAGDVVAGVPPCDLDALPSDCTRVAVRVGPSVRGLGCTLAAALAAGAIDDVTSLVPCYARAPDARLPVMDPSARRAAVLALLDLAPASSSPPVVHHSFLPPPSEIP